MQSTWLFLEEQEIQTVAISTRRIHRVLLRYDGPQLAILVDDAGSKFLATACDESDDGTIVRWIHSPVTGVEIDAMVSGTVAVRDLVLQPRVIVVDTSPNGQLVRAWAIDSDNLPSDALPDIGEPLPEHARQVPAFEKAHPSAMRIASSRSNHDSIAFTDLAEVLNQKQRLWLAIGQALAGKVTSKGKVKGEIAKKATLMASAVSPGSFAIDIAPGDESTFEAIAESYHDLTMAAESPERLQLALSEWGVRVAATFGDFAKALADRDLQVLSNWPGGRAFMGAVAAKRLKATPRHIKTRQEFAAIGYLIAISWSNMRFEFTDLDISESYIGSVNTSMFDDVLGEDGAGEVRVGHSTLYEARIGADVWEDIVAGGQTRQYELLSLKVVETEDIPDDRTSLVRSPPPVM